MSAEDGTSAGEGATTDDGVAEVGDTRQRFGVIDLIVAIVIGLLFAAQLWDAIGNLTGVPRFIEVRAPGWVLLVGSVALPVVLFVGGVLVGRGRPSFERTLVLVTAVSASAMLGLSLFFLSARILAL